MLKKLQASLRATSGVLTYLHFIISFYEQAGRFVVLNMMTYFELYVPELTIYAPMIYTAPCIMFWMRA
jgi:hypothetical protein